MPATRTRPGRWQLVLLRWVDPVDRHRHRYREALPPVLEEVARLLRSGWSVSHALAEAAGTGDDPVRVELRAVSERIAAGDDTGDALAWWGQHAADPMVGLPVAALTLAGESGGSRAWAVDQVAATLRERLALQGELRAQASQAGLSAMVLIVSPFAFAAITAMVDPRVVGFLVGSPAGWACLVTGCLLDAAGAWWMARIVRSPW